jgi:hypothetical protein
MKNLGNKVAAKKNRSFMAIGKRKNTLKSSIALFSYKTIRSSSP